jgi:hypothetical protein
LPWRDGLTELHGHAGDDARLRRSDDEFCARAVLCDFGVERSARFREFTRFHLRLQFRLCNLLQERLFFTFERGFVAQQLLLLRLQCEQFFALGIHLRGRHETFACQSF